MSGIGKALYDTTPFGMFAKAFERDKKPVAAPTTTVEVKQPTYDDLYLMEARRRAAKSALNRQASNASDPTKVGMMQ